MLARAEADLLGSSRTFDSEELADELESRRKKRRHAWLAWLLLGSHYLYLGRPFTQAVFWLSLGGLLVWWVVDLFRIPAMVERCNRRTSHEILRTWQQQYERRFYEPAPAPLWPRPAPPPAREPAPLPFAEAPHPEAIHPAPLAEPAPPGRSLRPGAGFVLLAALVAAASVYIFLPRPVYPRAVHEPSYRTLRQVNIRELPSTSSPIRGTAAKNVILRGQVEESATGGASAWLRITHGAHAGRYVALQNLDRR